jgi:PGF-pre-PGF domain-containing protein
MTSKGCQLAKTIQSHFQKKVVITKSLVFIIATVLFFLFNVVTLTNAAPTDDITSINITHPFDNSIVLMKEKVTGTSQNIPNGQKLWILVYPHNAYKYYPQHGSVAIENNGDWSIDIEIGTQVNVGEKFDIIAVLANQSAQNEFINYINTGINTKQWPGMPSIPNGAVEYAKVTVTRTNPPNVKITYPLSTVKLYDDITGYAKYIPEGKSPWIIIRPHTTFQYHPQVKPIFLDNENWTLSAQFGIVNDTDVQFDIIVVLANQSAQNGFSTYLNSKYPPNQWPGMSKLPDGTEELTRVTVKRLGILGTFADFTVNTISGTAPLTVQFTDSSTNVTRWAWDFGDGATSNEQNPSHTYSTPGNFNVKLTVSNNTNETSSKTVTITVDSGGENSGGESSGGESDGGGHQGSGGSESGSVGGSPEPQSNVEAKEIAQSFIASGNPVQFNFPKTTTPVVNISFVSKKTYGRTKAIAEMLKNQSTLVNGAPSDEIYKFINIWVGSSGFSTSDNIENAAVYFKVEKSWMKDKAVNQSSITLNRYSDSKWNSLTISLVGEDSKYLYFGAQTPGFSTFAITGKPAANGTGTDESVANGTGTDESVANGTDSPSGWEELKKVIKKDLPGFEAIFGMTTLLSVYLYRKK